MSLGHDDRWTPPPPYEDPDDPIPNHKELVEKYDDLKYIEVSSSGIVYHYEWVVDDEEKKHPRYTTYECDEEIFKPRNTKILVDRPLGTSLLAVVVRVRYGGLWARVTGYPELVVQDVERWGPKRFFSHDDLLRGLSTDTIQSFKHEENYGLDS